MWRAFFFAVGAMLILLGVQGLILDNIVIANGTRVPGFVAKFLNRGASNQAVRPIGYPNGSLNTNPNLLPQQVAVNAQRPSLQSIINPRNQTGSRFGPSRLADSQFSNTNLPPNVDYYGGVPFANRQLQNPGGFSGGAASTNPQFSLAGYGSQPGLVNSPNGYGNRLSPVTLGGGGSRLIRPTEWMPWGLLAVGTLVVLYTNSTGRRLTSE